MEELLKQVRSRFSGKESIGSAGEGRIPSQRTPSFRGERRPQKWFKRQLSRQMSFNYPSDEPEFVAAVAAAAFAITSLEYPDSVDERFKDEPHFSLPRNRSNVSDIYAATPEYIEAAQSFPETPEMVPEKTIHPVPSIKKTPSMPKKRLTFADQLPEDPVKPFVGRVPSMKKTHSFSEEQIEDFERIKPPSFRRTPTPKRPPSFTGEEFEYAERMKPENAPMKPILPSPTPPPPPAVPPLNIQPAVPPKAAQRRGSQETDADEWEREQMAKIIDKYQKLNATISDWEEKKKKKARRKLETQESDMDKKRAKAMHKYQTEMEQIKQIADGARAQAKEKQRKDEYKVKEKANRYDEINATIFEWEEKKKWKAKQKLQKKEEELNKKRAKAMHDYQTEMEQIQQIANGARAQAKENQKKEEVKVKAKANRYRETGQLPSSPVCNWS